MSTNSSPDLPQLAGTRREREVFYEPPVQANQGYLPENKQDRPIFNMVPSQVHPQANGINGVPTVFGQPRSFFQDKQLPHSLTTMSGYIRTGHMFRKGPDGNIYGKCLNRGCNVNAADAMMNRNCCGNQRFKITDEGDMITTNTAGDAVYSRKINRVENEKNENEKNESQ